MDVASVKDRVYKYIFPVNAIDMLLNGLRPDVEVIDTRSCVGRVLAEKLVSPIDRPWTDISHVDGYAIRSVDVAGAFSSSPVKLRLVKDVDPRNAHSYTLGTGEAVFVETGYPLPKGADVVVPIEATRVVGDHVYIYFSVPSGYHVFKRGSDIGKEAVLAYPGTRITLGLQKLLIDLEVREVKVYRKPRVALLSIGTEIVNEVIQPSTIKIPASNRYLLRHIIEYYGGEVIHEDIVSDEPNKIVEKVGKLISKADIIVTIGGVSMGPKDYSWTSLIKHYRPEKYFRGLKIHPGKSTSGLRIGNTIIINLPGLPQSTIAGAIFVLLPILNGLQGQKPRLKLPYIEAYSEEKVMLKKFYGFYRIRYVKINYNEMKTKVIEDVKSYHVSPFVFSDGFTIIDPDKKNIEKNEKIRVYFLEPLFKYNRTQIIL